MTKLHLIDGTYELFRSHFGAPPRQTPEGWEIIPAHPTMGGIWGYIDRSGIVAVKPAYNEARPFVNGKAMVHEGGRLQDIADAPSEWDGGRWLEIDKTGKVLRVVSE